MIETQLHVLMGKKRVNITDIYRATGISRSTLTKLWKGETKMLQLGTLDALCKYFNCEVGDLIKLVPDDKETDARKEKKYNVVAFRKKCGLRGNITEKACFYYRSQSGRLLVANDDKNSDEAQKWTAKQIKEYGLENCERIEAKE